MDIDNKRDCFRVDLLMPVKWRILNQSETDILKKGFGGTLLTRNCFKSAIDEMPEKVSSIKDDVYYSIQLLNNKLDYIINLMLKDSESVPSIDRILEISASGLKFRTAEKIDVGVFLKMDLLIPWTSHFQVELIAESLRIDKTDNGYILAAKIICIDEDAREFIVKMVFQKQRIDIRRFKTSQEV